MEYAAKLSKEGRITLIEFPDCPGCQTFFDPKEDTNFSAVAREALEGWLEAHLVAGQSPPRPATRARGLQMRMIKVRAALGLTLEIRWQRQALELSQAQLGKRLGVTRQQVASLEDPDANWTLATLLRTAEALGLELEISLRRPSEGARAVS